jgi:hypothetical protein
MVKKTKEKTINEQAQSPQAFPTEATSKAMLMANVLDVMGKMSRMDLTKWHDQAMAMIGHEADSIPSGTAAKNLASVGSSGAVNEELAEILAGENLSEDFRSKAAILFEAAVGAKVAVKTAEIEEMFESRLNEEIDQVSTGLQEKVDMYLSHVAKEFIKENKVQVRQTIRTELAEDFITGMYKLFTEHYVSIPEDRVDVVEALSTKVKELQEELNHQINENIEKAKQLEGFQKGEALEEVSEGLAMTQKDKLKKLSEGIAYSGNMDEYKNKLKVIRESFIKKPVGDAAGLNDSVPEEKSDAPAPQTAIDRLVKHISKTVKN